MTAAGRKVTPAMVDAAYKALSAATRGNPISSEELGRAIGISDDPEGNPLARSIVLEVMRTKRLPVVANSTGYFVPKTYAEVREYVSQLQHRQLGIMERAALIDSLWHEAHPEDPAPDTESADEL